MITAAHIETASSALKPARCEAGIPTRPKANPQARDRCRQMRRPEPPLRTSTGTKRHRVAAGAPGRRKPRALPRATARGVLQGPCSSVMVPKTLLRILPVTGNDATPRRLRAHFANLAWQAATACQARSLSVRYAAANERFGSCEVASRARQIASGGPVSLGIDTDEDPAL